MQTLDIKVQNRDTVEKGIYLCRTGLKVSISGLILQSIAAISVLILSATNLSVLQKGLALYLVSGMPVWLIVILHIHQQKLALLEQIEEEELKSRYEDKSKIFEQISSVYSAKERLKQVEKWVVPVFSILIATFSLYLSFIYFNVLTDPAFIIKNPALSAAFLFPLSFFLFLLGKFSACLSESLLCKPLRAGSSVMLAGALLCFVSGISSSLFHFGFQVQEKVFSFLIFILLAVLGAEKLVCFILEIYRPKTEASKYFLYESRILCLLVKPKNITDAILESLNYQFGFKVSQVWLFSFFEKILAPLILFQAGAFLLLTVMVTVGPGERAIVERFGKPRKYGEVLLPGIHFKWPFPIEKVYTYPFDKVQVMWLGCEDEEHEKARGAYLWTKAHYKMEHSFLVAGKTQEEDMAVANIICMDIQVQYKIRDVHLYAYSTSNPVAVLRNIAYRNAVRKSASLDIMDAMTSGRMEFARGLKHSIQDFADRYNLGIQIVNVLPASMHPPVHVVDAYQGVIASMEQKETSILRAKGYRAALLPIASANAASLIYQSESYAARTVLLASSDAERFSQRLLSERVVPLYYRMKLYLDSLKIALSPTRKYILPSGVSAGRITVINLEEKVTPEMLFMEKEENKR